MRKTNWTALARFLAAAGLAGVLGACAQSGGDADAAPARVKVLQASYADLPCHIVATGIVDSARTVQMRAPQDARVARILFREGQAVRKGALVVRLENPRLVLAVQEAEHAVARADSAVALSRSRLREAEFEAEARVLLLRKAARQLELKRSELAERERKHRDQERLHEAGGLSREAIRTARFELETARVELGLLERDLEIQSVGLRPEDLEAAAFPQAQTERELLLQLVALCTASLRAQVAVAEAEARAARDGLAGLELSLRELELRAPLDAIVGSLEAEEAELVARDAPIATLYSSQAPCVVVMVGESDALKLRPGQTATIEMDALGASFEARVQTVYPASDARTGSSAVRLALATRDERLRPGLFARARIRWAEDRRALVLPRSSLVESGDGRARMFRVVAGLVQPRELALGVNLDEACEVVSGLEPGDLVIDRPHAGIRENEHVVIIE